MERDMAPPEGLANRRVGRLRYGSAGGPPRPPRFVATLQQPRDSLPRPATFNEM
jgi:hypothetical protein